MKTILAIAALALTAAAVPAHAESAPSISIRFGDLDLSSAAGQARLDGRINSAVNRACLTGSRDLAATGAERSCRAELAHKVRASIALNRSNVRVAAIPANPGA